MEFLRANRRIESRIAADPAVLVTSMVTAAELFFGAAKSRQAVVARGLVQDLLAKIRPLNLTIEAARLFGELKADLERTGQRLADADLLIAAIALATGATLVTGNRRHFDRIHGLAIENWLADSA